MALDIDRIRQLAATEDADLPPISTEQAEATVRLLSTSSQQQRRPRLAG